jgi:hypothetical protein
MRIVFGFIAVVCALSPALAQPAGQTTSSVAHAQALPARIPIEVDLQTAGGLRHADGVTVVVSLYAQRDSTDALWTEEQDVRPDDGGRVKLLAGASTDAGIPQQLFQSADARWLGIAVKGETEQPRIMVMSMPYAVEAQNAETVGGHHAADLVTRAELQSILDEMLDRRQREHAEGGGSSGRPQSQTRLSGRIVNGPVLDANSARIPRRSNSGGTVLFAGKFDNNLASGDGAVGAWGRAFSTSDGTAVNFGVTGVLGTIETLEPGLFSAGVRGVNDAAGANGAGVIGYHAGTGNGVYGDTPYGVGVYGESLYGAGVLARHGSIDTPGTALQIDNGALKVSGTVRTAFTMSVPPTTANGYPAVPIDNPLCNFDPFALIFVENVGALAANPLGGPLIPYPTNTHQVYLNYIGGMWYIMNADGSSFSTSPTNPIFNVLIIKQ